MFALKVRINDEQPIVAGAEDLVVLNAMVNCAGKLGVASHSPRPSEKQDFNCHVGGLTSRALDLANEHLRWLQRWELKVGDRVTIEIVETDRADPVVSSYPARGGPAHEA
jgi:hypothetical protein